jgi:hypothetical protein
MLAATKHGACDNEKETVVTAGLIEPLGALTGHSTGEDARATFELYIRNTESAIHTHDSK